MSSGGKSTTGSSAALVIPIPRVKDAKVQPEERFVLMYTCFMFNLIGLGLRQQSVANWIVLFASTSVTLLAFTLRMTKFTLDVHNINHLCAYTTRLLVILTFIMKRESLYNWIKSSTSLLSPKNKRIVAKVDIILFIVNFCVIALDIGLTLYFDGHHPFASISIKTTLISLTFIRKVLIAYSILLENWFLIVFSLYITSFTAVYLIKHITLAKLQYVIVKSNKKTLTNCLVTIKSLHGSFESFFSVFAFYLFTWNLIGVIFLFYTFIAAQGNSGEVHHNLLIIIYEVAVANSICISLIAVVSLLQERISVKCFNLCSFIDFKQMTHRQKYLEPAARQIKYSFIQPVTVWRTIGISRSVIMSMSYAYLTLAVIMLQINNGQLGKIATPFLLPQKEANSSMDSGN